MKKIIFCSDKAYVVEYREHSDDECLAVVAETIKETGIAADKFFVRAIQELESGKEILNTYRDGTLVQSTLPGMVVKLCVAEGSRVQTGDTLVIVESMKMENEIKAPCDGIVAFLIPEGITVKQGEELVLLR